MKTQHMMILAVLLIAVMICGYVIGACMPPPAYANTLPAAGTNNLQNAGINTPENHSIKVIGMIGGVSWLSSAEYYRIMNEELNTKLGDPHSAKILMYSIDFADVSDEVKRASPQDMQYVSGEMVAAARRLKAGGADFIIVGSNTMNAFDADIERETGIPVLNIADATGEKVNESGVKKVILLGSKIVMEQSYYRDILEKKYNLTVILPNESERNYTNSVIFDELVVGDFRNESRDGLVKIINRLEKDEGARGVILGCTELPLLIKQKDVNVPVFDTTTIHAQAAVEYALGERQIEK